MRALGFALLLLLVTGTVAGQTASETTKQAFESAVKQRSKMVSVSATSEAQEKSYIEANKLYPGLYGDLGAFKAVDGSYDYLPFLRMRRQDIRGANKAWTDAINKLQRIE